MNKFSFPLMAGLAMLSACQCSSPAQPPRDSQAALREAYASSPVLSPKESLERMQVESGFEVRLVASEPLVNTPVAMTFDRNGRMWVVEMPGYMQDETGAGEDLPSGKIIILEDHDKDGKADERKIFMDSLVLPRAICLVDDGLLVAEPPRLWFVEIRNDRPGRKLLVDGEYAVGGNPESQPNGLLRALDNWIYSGGSDKRYRRKDGRWLIERTHRRGQWGITQDDQGRLFYNNNSRNVLGDYFTPGLGASNRHQKAVSGFNETIVPDNRVYPARPTPGVNRGYKEGVLDDSLRLTTFTAACGPVLYRGHLFGADWYGNVFVAEPAANLIKRNILQAKGYTVSGKQAWEGREFLASTDERFRPVSLYQGPEGALYVLDMYRGIIQHKDFLTDYLKAEIGARGLTRPLACGRIYRIVPQGSDPRPLSIPDDPLRLAALLKHPDGWVRDMAQQALVDGKHTAAVPELRKLLAADNDPLARIHALWTLEGLGALEAAEILPLLEGVSMAGGADAARPKVEGRAPTGLEGGGAAVQMLRIQGLSVLPSVLSESNYKQFLPRLEALLHDTLWAPYVAFLAGHIGEFNENAATGLLLRAAGMYPENEFVADAVISNLEGKEAAFLEKWNDGALPPDALVAGRLQKILDDQKRSRENKRHNEELKKAMPEAYALYSSTCQPCHGAAGEGVKQLAPPLNRSEWVTGDKDQLISIVLFGLSGPVEVNGTLYTDQDVTGDMPGIGNNPQFSDEDLAALLTYIRNAWSNRAGGVSAGDIRGVRERFGERKKTFTMEELHSLFGRKSAAK